MKIVLKIDKDSLTLDDLIYLESSGKSNQSLKEFLARFLVGEDGKVLAEGEARQVIGKLSLSDIDDVMAQLTDKLREIRESAIPPVSGGE